MNTLEITSAINSKPGMVDQFLGVFAPDEIANLKIQKFPAALIVNTDRSSDSGEHWVWVYIDGNRNGEYFDSYGREPLAEVLDLSKATKLTITNIIMYLYSLLALLYVASIVYII